MKNLIVAAVMVFGSVALADNGGKSSNQVSQQQAQQMADEINAANAGKPGNEMTADDVSCVMAAVDKTEGTVDKYAIDGNDNIFNKTGKYIAQLFSVPLFVPYVAQKCGWGNVKKMAKWLKANSMTDSDGNKLEWDWNDEFFTGGDGR